MGRNILGVKDYSLQVRKVLLLTLVLNSLVAIMKIMYGYATNSIAMTSDGFHSFFDGISNIVGFIGIWIASYPPDERHPYGHKKYETLFTIIIAIMIFLTCFQILKKIYFSFQDMHKTSVTFISFTVMFITMMINIIVMLYESKKGKQLCSEILIADAMHTKSDIFASIAVIVSLIFSRMGYYYADIIVGVIITFLIARIGFKIIKGASDILVDTVCINTSVIEGVVNSIDGVRGCRNIRTRGQENAVYLDMAVVVDKNLPIEKAHSIADNIEEKIKKEFPSIIDIVVHIEPEKS